MPAPHPDYHHDTLTRFGFQEKSEGYYRRPATGTHPLLHVIHGRGRGLYLWSLGRPILRADSVTTDALEQVLRGERVPETITV